MSIRASRAREAGRREEEECLLELNLSKNILLADFLVSSVPHHSCLGLGAGREEVVVLMGPK